VIGDGAGRVGVVPAVKPELRACGAASVKRAHGAGAASARAMSPGVQHCGLTGGLAIGRACATRPAPVPAFSNLVCDRAVRASGRSSSPRFVLEHQPPAFGPTHASADHGRGLAARQGGRRALRSPRAPRRCWRPTTTGTPRLMIPGLLAGDLRQRVTEELLVVHVHRRDHRQRGAFRPHWSHPAARPSPTSSSVMSAGVSGEGDEGGGGGDLEIGDRIGSPLAARQRSRMSDSASSSISSPASRMRSWNRTRCGDV
jgi:hypothetical protein